MRSRILIPFLRNLVVASVVPAESRSRPASVLGAFLQKPFRSRRLLIVAALVASALVGSWFPEISAPFRSSSTVKAPAASEKPVEGLVKLTAEQIAATKIEIATASPGTLRREVVTPALVTADPDRVGRVAAKVAGVVAELRKNLGDSVQKDEVVAVIDSREVADAKSEYLAAVVSHDLQNTLFQREKGLFEKKITAEQLYLKAQTALAEAKLRLDLARQKLAALDLSESEIATLPKQPVRDLRRKDIHASVSGKIIERRANVGQPVGGEGQEKELYVIADLSGVWAELSVPIAVLPEIREKQFVRLSHGDEKAEGRIVFINPMLSHETHSGRVIARFDNKDFALRPGTLMSARIALAEKPVRVKVPRTALLTVNGDRVVFVRTPDGFLKREVETGESDDAAIEIVSGLEPGEAFAATNTFVLKGELGKADLEALD